MTLNFPNASRSYDPTEGFIRFWGRDGALEVSFFVEESALRQIAPGARNDEAAALKIFDANRERIFKAARTVYSHRRKGSYALVASDFWRNQRRASCRTLPLCLEHQRQG